MGRAVPPPCPHRETVGLGNAKLFCFNKFWGSSWDPWGSKACRDALGIFFFPPSCPSGQPPAGAECWVSAKGCGWGDLDLGGLCRHGCGGAHGCVHTQASLKQAVLCLVMGGTGSCSQLQASAASLGPCCSGHPLAWDTAMSRARPTSQTRSGGSRRPAFPPDITHPIPDLTGFITEGQIYVDRQLHNRQVGSRAPSQLRAALNRGWIWHRCVRRHHLGLETTREHQDGGCRGQGGCLN